MRWRTKPWWCAILPGVRGSGSKASNGFRSEGGSESGPVIPHNSRKRRGLMTVDHRRLGRPMLLAGSLGIVTLLTGGFLGLGGGKSGIDPKAVADMLHAVMQADRTVYTRVVV